MALDRQSIEKKDFPIGRRGYDPSAVDAHLTSMAEQVEELRSQVRRRSEGLAEEAAGQVRTIVEAAEASAAQIRADAEKDARDIRREARTEAKQLREEATAQASQYVGTASSATTAMTERVDAIEQELSALMDSLRTSAGRATSDLQLLERHLMEVRDAVLPRPEFEPEEESEAAATYEPPVERQPEDGTFGAVPAGDLLYEPETSTLPESPPDLAVPEPAAPEASDDTEGARLIALNMALNGTPRDEVDRYLAENFELSDRAGLIEEVYSSVEG